MTTEQMIKELRRVADKHKNDVIGVGELNIHAMCIDVANRLEELLKQSTGSKWIPADEPPKTDDYILLSFENFTIPMVGRYEKFEDGSGNYYLGDCDEKDTCLANNLFVNGWQPLPAPYRPDQEEPEQPKVAWKEAMMKPFLGGTHNECKRI